MNVNPQQNKMKIYISGQITGLGLEEARAKFDKAEKALIGKGHNPINPMKLNIPIEGKTWKDYMLDDLELLFDCEAIFLLDNWQASKGARIEYSIAQEMEMTILMNIE